MKAMKRSRAFASAVAVTAVLVLFATACSGDDGVSIGDPWARTSAGMADAGAAYMQITGGDADDRLVSVSVPPSIAGMAQVHESSMSDDGTGKMMMSMQEVEGIDISAGSTVVLEPGGYHIMMMNLAEPLENGSSFTITLTFETAGDVEVTVTVRDEE